MCDTYGHLRKPGIHCSVNTTGGADQCNTDQKIGELVMHISMAAETWLSADSLQGKGMISKRGEGKKG